MINKDDLKDWLAESERKAYAKELEEFIDEEIKINALAGKMTFLISTGKYTRDGSRRTPFYDLWNTDKLSSDNRKIVRSEVVKKYREFGFKVKETSEDCGWNRHYFALQFIDIDKVLEVSE